MIVILKDRADERQVENLTMWLQSMNIGTHISRGSEHTIIGLIGDTSAVDIELLQSLDVVSAVKRIQEPYKNANRKFHEDDTVIELENGTKIGGGHFSTAAGDEISADYACWASSAAATSPENSGCGLFGRLWNSG